MEKRYRLEELARLFDVVCDGDPTCTITGLASPSSAKPGHIVCVYKKAFLEGLKTTKASAVILSQNYLNERPVSLPALVTDHPRRLSAQVSHLFYVPPKVSAGIHSSAVIGENCVIDPTVSIGPLCVIGEGVHIGSGSVLRSGCIIGDKVVIGANCQLWPNVTLYHKVSIGNEVMIHSGTVVGSDGFGFVQDEQNQWLKIPQLGRVIIKDNVEIGANVCIDRGTLDDTVIGVGVKLDNHIQIAHNVHIGPYTVMAGCSAVAGSTKIGAYCMMGGNCRFSDGITIVDGSIFTAGTKVTHSIHKPGVYSSGLRAQPHREWQKNTVRFKQLDTIARRLAKLETMLSS